MLRVAGTCVLLAAGGVRRGLATGVDVGAGASVGSSVGVSLGAHAHVGMGMGIGIGMGMGMGMRVRVRVRCGARLQPASRTVAKVRAGVGHWRPRRRGGVSGWQSGPRMRLPPST